MVINIIRHGESQANYNQTYPYYGTPLTERGERQAQLSKGPIQELVKGTKVLISPYKRALDTAKNLEIKGTVEEGIREMAFGDLVGMTFDEIKRDMPEVAKDMLSADPTYVLPGGESIDGFLNRVFEFFDKIIKEGESVSLICHDGIMKGLFCYIYGKEQFFKITTDNVGVMRVEVFEDMLVMKYFNRVFYTENPNH